MGVIEARGVVKDYPRVRALDELTLDIPPGAVGLLGPNGAGKSTLLKLVLGFISPTSGAVRVLGLDPGVHPLEVRRLIGFMPEVESFIPTVSAVDFVYLAARLSALPHTDALQRAHAVLDYVGVREERYRKMGAYSTGMKQKVKFAQAIVHSPKLLLLDEPTTGLDPVARDEMLSLIRDIARGRGIDVILSTHILPDVEAVCSHAIILHRGKLVAQDAISTLTAARIDAREVRIKGDRDAFLRALEAEGVRGAAPSGADSVVLPPSPSTAPILRAAVSASVQIRRLTPSRGSLEETFNRLLAS